MLSEAAETRTESSASDKEELVGGRVDGQT